MLHVLKYTSSNIFLHQEKDSTTSIGRLLDLPTNLMTQQTTWLELWYFSVSRKEELVDHSELDFFLLFHNYRPGKYPNHRVVSNAPYSWYSYQKANDQQRYQIFHNYQEKDQHHKFISENHHKLLEIACKIEYQQ